MKLRSQIAFLLMITGVFIQNAQSQSYIIDGQRLPEYYEKYKETASLKSDKDLIEMLKVEKMFKDKQILIEELKSRGAINMDSLLAEMIKYSREETLRLERFKTERIAFYTIELAKLNKHNTIVFLNKIEELLEEATKTRNIYLARGACTELHFIGDSDAINILKKYENDFIDVKMSKLILETRGLNQVEKLNHLLNSVKEELICSNLKKYPKFIAERSLINGLTNPQDTLKILETEKIKPNVPIRIDYRKHRIYYQFLESIAFKVSNPGVPTNPLFNPNLAYLSRMII